MRRRSALSCSLSHLALHGRGEGVRVAIVDSGVHAAHPHVQGVACGVGIDTEGRVHDDMVDRLGHGTAVAAVIREKAPEAEILIVKVFDRELRTSAQSLIAAVEWAIEQRAHLVNLSLGTADQTHEGAFRSLAARARAAGRRIVAAVDREGVQWLPGSVRSVVGVEVDWTIPRETAAFQIRGEHIHARASGYPRPIPGVSPELNLRGVSFAVANVTGLLAQLRSLGALESETSPDVLRLRHILGRSGRPV